MSHLFFILEGKKVKAVSKERWQEWCVEKEKEGSDWTRVARTELSPNIAVSTVFILGINHSFSAKFDSSFFRDAFGIEIEDSNAGEEWKDTGEEEKPPTEDHNIPVLFETMIFSPEFPKIDQMRWRYTTWADAEAGHEEAVDVAKKHIEEWHQGGDEVRL